VNAWVASPAGTTLHDLARPATAATVYHRLLYCRLAIVAAEQRPCWVAVRDPSPAIALPPPAPSAVDSAFHAHYAVSDHSYAPLVCCPLAAIATTRRVQDGTGYEYTVYGLLRDPTREPEIMCRAVASGLFLRLSGSCNEDSWSAPESGRAQWYNGARAVGVSHHRCIAIDVDSKPREPRFTSVAVRQRLRLSLYGCSCH
jgi:hypothetical protein